MFFRQKKNAEHTETKREKLKKLSPIIVLVAFLSVAVPFSAFAYGSGSNHWSFRQKWNWWPWKSKQTDQNTSQTTVATTSGTGTNTTKNPTPAPATSGGTTTSAPATATSGSTSSGGTANSSPTTTPPAPAQTTTTQTGSNYPWHNNIQTSWFYIGEPSGPENGNIPNDVSAWDGNWMSHYGGVDSPTPARVAPYYYPNFTPKENPFYFALPYNDLTDSGSRRADAKNIPWWTGDPGSGASVVKNRWIEITYNGKTSYAQWEDVGPNLSDDFNYVFGAAAPQNTFGVHSGLDISPAVRDYLGADNSKVSWRFVDASQVPAGPWENVVTTSQVSW